MRTNFVDRAQRCKNDHRSYPLPLPTAAQKRLLRRALTAAEGGRDDGWFRPEPDQWRSAQALFEKGYLESRLEGTGVRFSHPYTHPDYSFTYEYRLSSKDYVREWVSTLLEGVPALMDKARG